MGKKITMGGQKINTGVIICAKRGERLYNFNPIETEQVEGNGSR